MKNVSEIASELGIKEDEFDQYGKYMGKVSLNVLQRLNDRKDGKMVLVTAINPTSAGEGKTTTTIAVSQGLKKLGKNVMITIREPSLGPNFGIKGGGTGGGKCMLQPADEINLNFTGDFPAISAAHNLLSALVNNHIFHGNQLGFDLRKVAWNRTIDMNDRSLREIVVGLGNMGGATLGDSFLITPASEIMAIMGFADSYSSLKQMLSKITIGYKRPGGDRITAGDLKAEGAMASLLKNAIKPNLVQTTEGVPALVHIGPFANIAHGHNSIVADRIALKLSDYVITEAGFGSDLGGQKFIDIVTRRGKIPLDLVIIVVSIRALKNHGGMKKGEEGIEFLKKGMDNLYYHIHNMQRYGLPFIISLNRFESDTDEEIEFLKSEVAKMGSEVVINSGYLKGGEGALDLANAVARKLDELTQSGTSSQINYTYSEEDELKTKIEKVAKNAYGAKSVRYSKEALSALKKAKDEGLNNLEVCMAKTQYSITDDQTKLGWPKDFVITIENITLSTGVGFAVPLLGNIMTMPGLPRHPITEEVDIDDEGNITGLL